MNLYDILETATYCCGKMALYERAQSLADYAQGRTAESEYHHRRYREYRSASDACHSMANALKDGGPVQDEMREWFRKIEIDTEVRNG
jgi:hypothetical protein